MIRPGDRENPQSRDDPASPTRGNYPRRATGPAPDEGAAFLIEKEFANPIPLPRFDLADRADAEARRSG
jgi:hypothetical protein